MGIKAYIVRVWRDAGGTLCGQVTDPQTDVRAPFHGQQELLGLLTPDTTPPPPPLLQSDEGDHPT